MKSILIPTDFSVDARNAALYAIALFGTMDCQYFLIHAYSIPARPNPSMFIKDVAELKVEVVESLEEERKLIIKHLEGASLNIRLLAEPGPLTVHQSLI